LPYVEFVHHGLVTLYLLIILFASALSDAWVFFHLIVRLGPWGSGFFFLSTLSVMGNRNEVGVFPSRSPFLLHFRDCCVTLFSGIGIWEAIDCVFGRESLIEWDSSWPWCKGPVLLCGEVRHIVLWVTVVHHIASFDEVRTASVPAGMCVDLASDTVSLGLIGTEIGAVWVATGATGILIGHAAFGIVTPFSAFHALCRFLLLLCGPNSGVTDAEPISY
jgi:hypothetical protein